MKALAAQAVSVMAISSCSSSENSAADTKH
jgi:hypothetical protein